MSFRVSNKYGPLTTGEPSVRGKIDEKIEAAARFICDTRWDEKPIVKRDPRLILTPEDARQIMGRQPNETDYACYRDYGVTPNSVVSCYTTAPAEPGPPSIYATSVSLITTMCGSARLGRSGVVLASRDGVRDALA